MCRDKAGFNRKMWWSRSLRARLMILIMSWAAGRMGGDSRGRRGDKAEKRGGAGCVGTRQGTLVAERVLMARGKGPRCVSRRMEGSRFRRGHVLRGPILALCEPAAKFAVLLKQFPDRSGQGSVVLPHFPVFIAQFTQVLAQLPVVAPQVLQFVGQSA